MSNRNPVGPHLNLTVSGRLLAYESRSGSHLAKSAIDLAGQIASSWTRLYNFGLDARADKSRPELEREALVSQLAAKTIKEVSPAVSKAMQNLIARTDTVQATINKNMIEADPLAAMKGQEARAYLRGLSSDTERAAALADPMLAKAAASAPARLSGLTAQHHEHVRKDVTQREMPSEMAELADLEYAKDTLYMAGNSLVSNAMSYSHSELSSSRVEMPTGPAIADA